MSAFGFINNNANNSNNSHSSRNTSNASGSPLLSSSLIEDLYDSRQNLDTFVNQSRTFSLPSKAERSSSPLFPSSHSSPKKHVKAPKPISSYFSFIDDISSSFPTSKSSPPPTNCFGSNDSRSSSPDFMKKSAFAFISQSTTALPKTNHSSAEGSPSFYRSFESSPAPRRTIKPNTEMKLISATSSLQRLQASKSNELNTLQRLYTKQLSTYDQISTLKSKIHLVQQQKDIALMSEDFLLAETLQTQEQKMSASLMELSSNQAQQTQIHASWQRVCDLMSRESEAAQHVVTCCEQVKDERHLQHMKFVTDNERLHQQKLQDIGKQRALIESEKSEVAFDLGLWEQSEEDLQERQDDAIHEDLVKKKGLDAQSDLIQGEMDDLLLRLKALQEEKHELTKQIAALDVSMKEKLSPFADERHEHEQEHEHIEKRRAEIDHKAAQLDQQDTQVDLEITRHQEENERGLNEIQALEEQIQHATKTSQQVDCVTLAATVLKDIENRDRIVTQHKSELQKSRELILRKRKIIESIQQTVYAKQQKSINLDEAVMEIEQKLKSLARHKQLAIEAGRFQNAAAWTNQIKIMEKELNKLKQDQQREKETNEDEHLIKQQEELSDLEQGHLELEEKTNTEIKLILEKSKEELQEIAVDEQDKVLTFIVEHELKSIEAQLDVVLLSQ